MNTAFIDNRAHILKDELIKVIRSGNRISIASSVFSVYAYDELREQLESLDEFRFIYTEPTFSKEQVKKERREFYIPRLNREQGLYGTEFEIKLRNELTQKVIASEFAQWVKQKAHFKSPQGNTAEVAPALTVDSGEDVVTYMPINKLYVVK